MVPLPGGYRGSSMLVTTSDGERYVLRHPAGATTCATEVAVLDRARGVVPVPEVVATDPDGRAAGRPLMLYRFIGGRPLDRVLPDLPPDGATELGRAVGHTLAAIGSVTFPRHGFFAGPDLDPRLDALPAMGSLAEFVDHCLDSGNARTTLDGAERAGLRRLAVEVEPLVSRTSAQRHLVHSDFNPKNLVVDRDPAGWRVVGVLDWEFAFSGPQLVDIGNMLRFGDELPPGFAAGFPAGFRAAGGDLPPDWLAISRALDLYALVEFSTRPPDTPIVRAATRLLRQRIRDGI